MLSLTDHQNKVETGREEARGEMETERGRFMLHSTIHLFFFFFLDDSYFPVFRQKQQVFPKHIMDPWSSRQGGLGLAEAQGKAEGKGLPCWEAIGYSSSVSRRSSASRRPGSGPCTLRLQPDSEV